jgi:ribosomal protein L16 Arg81 hydroxylase
MDLNTLFAPLGWDAFENLHFRKTPLVLHGPGNRFGELVTSDAIESVLSTHRFTPRRLSFVKAGVPAPRSAYLWDFKEDAALVRADGVKQLIDDGYHMVLNGVDELWAGIREIAEAWEPVIGAYVAVNMYAVWAGAQGFKIHFDKHDTLLLQTSGRKRWTVYAPDAHIDPAAENQTAEPALSCVLEAGSLLYIPRGWWHVGRAEGAHSVHVTVGIEGDTTHLFLQWCLREWNARSWALEPLPWNTDTDRVTTFLADLARRLESELTPENFARFREWKAGQTAVRPRAHVNGRTGAPPDLDRGSLVRWRTPARIEDSSDGAVAVRIDGWTAPVPSTLAPAVRRIHRWPPVRWDELTSAVDTAGSVSLLRSWIGAMALGGHLSIDAPHAVRGETRHT